MQRKMGLGDLLIYLIIACYFTPSFANLVFLFASILVIAIFLIEKTPINHRYPFIPYIFLGLVLTQLIFLDKKISIPALKRLEMLIYFQ